MSTSGKCVSPLYVHDHSMVKMVQLVLVLDISDADGPFGNV